MTHFEPAHDLRETSLQRRKFLRNSILLALPAATAGQAAAAVTMSTPLPAMRVAAYSPPRRDRGNTGVNVRNHGALGNGSHDDTTAFQNAIDALPPAGGTVHVPAGTYVLDPTRRVKLRSRMHLMLDSGAVLKAKANAAERYYVLSLYKVHDVEISGGEIEGDRDRHNGTTGEWGHGIMVRGSSRVTIRGILIHKCWGDGICLCATTKYDTEPGIASVDIAIFNVACIDNRRQGMTIARTRNVKVYNSEFSYTGGAEPGHGIDIESDDLNPGASGTHIQNCVFEHNESNAIMLYKRSENTTILNCRMKNNGGYGVLAMGTKNALIRSNDIYSNGLIGVGIRASSRGCDISRNSFYNNARRFRSKDTQWLSPARARTGNVLSRHTEVAGSYDIDIWTNYYHDE